jgi:rhodanese-related sulfurtransferase
VSQPWRPAKELSLLLAAALACAWISNRAAGPTRRLAWLPEAPAALAAAPIPEAPAPLPAPVVVAPAPPRAEPPAKKAAKERTAPPAAEPDAWDPATLLARFPPLQGVPFADVDSDDARWLQLHGALLLDARRSEAYAEGHLPGALSLPVWEEGLQAKIAGLASGANAARADAYLPVLIYCAGGDCEDSRLLAVQLRHAGHRNLRVYTGGFPDWESHAWPVERGAAR